MSRSDLGQRGQARSGEGCSKEIVKKGKGLEVRENMAHLEDFKYSSLILYSVETHK